MIMDGSVPTMFLTSILYGACATLYVALTALILVPMRLSRAGFYLALASAVSAIWAGLFAAGVGLPWGGPGGLFDLLRSIVWYLFLLHLYRRTVVGRNSLSQAFIVTGLVAVVIVLTGIISGYALRSGGTLWSVSTGVRLGLAVCNILLIENLYRNTPQAAKWHINLPCIALMALFAYDLVLWADAALIGHLSPPLVNARAVAAAFVVPLLAVGAARNRAWAIDIHVSRQVVFHSATLVLAGLFLIGLAGLGEAMRYFGADWGATAQIGLVFAGFVIVAVLVTSGSARSWLQRLLVDHFFSRRYDYEREWLRCITMLSGDDMYVPLHSRVIRAVGGIVDSPGGAVFLRQDSAAPDARFTWAGSWNMPATSGEVAADHPLIAAFGADPTAVLLADHPALAADPVLAGAWLAVPLSLGPRGKDVAADLLGFVLVTPPRAGFVVDREVLDLLRIIARQVAAAIAARQGAEVLMQTRALHDYGKRFAFVAHDIKNVSGQLTLLLANAEHHLSNPEFQRDMLVTVRASVARITGLLRRLQTPDSKLTRATVRPAETLERIGNQFARRTIGQAASVLIEVSVDGAEASVAMSPGSFEAVVTHLLNNAIEATLEAASPAPVHLALRCEGRRATVDVVDRGSGMTADFIRDGLFRPFVTSKPLGSGIGAFQARELLREAGGDLQVISAPGAGTTMRIMLPLMEAAAA
jgi:putative PEP-CTERM system histidine kinase